VLVLIEENSPLQSQIKGTANKAIENYKTAYLETHPYPSQEGSNFSL
jgi:hypothetical protein